MEVTSHVNIYHKNKEFFCVNQGLSKKITNMEKALFWGHYKITQDMFSCIQNNFRPVFPKICK
jgi:hypothetical protein